MYRFAENPNADSEISVLGIPFRVFKNGGRIERIAGGPVQIEGRFTSLYFLGMATESWQCSEWWGQQEVLYDHSTRLFFGDRIGNFRIVFDDETLELVSVIFGVNAFTTVFTDRSLTKAI